MKSVREDVRQFVGPHEGRELELMLNGDKPLSMFVESIPTKFEVFSEQDFDRLVSQGKLVKHVSIETIPALGGKTGKIRRVLYALPSEEWRIEALLLVQALYVSLAPGWRPDLERLIGLLLGYSRRDIEKFLDLHESR
ncbi:MAG TPA: hypothetical protein VFL53_15715 [Pseudolabrys sp.]|nr:hypothetical protein [Pseudolabrys sp.]